MADRQIVTYRCGTTLRNSSERATCGTVTVRMLSPPCRIIHRAPAWLMLFISTSCRSHSPGIGSMVSAMCSPSPTSRQAPGSPSPSIPLRTPRAPAAPWEMNRTGGASACAQTAFSYSSSSVARICYSQTVWTSRPEAALVIIV
jgi:hypothetical protein